jgi:hypothetical protein
MAYTRAEKALRRLFLALILGAVAFFIYDEYSEARMRYRIKYTLSTMRKIGYAWEQRATDLNRYNAAGGSVLILPAINQSEAVTFPYRLEVRDVSAMLVPKYIKQLPRDEWDRDFEFWVDKPYPMAGDVRSENYLIRSAGADGVFVPVSVEPCSGWNCDLVFSNGMVVTRWP